MKYKNVLVTGGCGFIGSNFIHYLYDKNDCISVVNLDCLSYAGNKDNLCGISENNSYFFYEGSINDEELVNKVLKKHNIQCIVNFAAESHVDKSISDPHNFINTNILGTYNLINSFNKYIKDQKFDCLFLHVSTDEVFGSLKKEDPPFTENNNYKPNSPYSASKASSDLLVKAWNKTYNFPAIITNCSNNYGPYQYPEKLIPLTIYNAINGNNINIYGDGSNIRDWLFVRDHCSGIYKVINSGKVGETYNIGGNNELDNNQLINLICQILDELIPAGNNQNTKFKKYSELIRYVPDRPGHDFRYSINSNKLASDLNWSPNTDLLIGLKMTVQWYLDNQNWMIKSLKK